MKLESRALASTPIRHPWRSAPALDRAEADTPQSRSCEAVDAPSQRYPMNLPLWDDDQWVVLAE